MKKLKYSLNQSLILFLSFTGIILCTVTFKMSLHSRSSRRFTLLKYILTRPQRALRIVSAKTIGLPAIPDEVKVLFEHNSVRIFHLAAKRYIFISDIYLYLHKILTRDFSFKVLQHIQHNVNFLEFTFNDRYYLNKHPVRIIILSRNFESTSLFTFIAIER